MSNEVQKSTRFHLSGLSKTTSLLHPVRFLAKKAVDAPPLNDGHLVGGFTGVVGAAEVCAAVAFVIKPATKADRSSDRSSISRCRQRRLDSQQLSNQRPRQQIYACHRIYRQSRFC